MLESVLDEIRAKLGALDLSRGGCHVLLALPEVRPGFCDADGGWISAKASELLQARQVNARVAVGGRGHAGALACIEQVAALSARDRGSLYLVIGLDSYLTGVTLSWLEGRRQLAQPATRNGFFPGEAAACLVLASRPVREHLRLQCLARIVGTGVAHETRLRDSETGSLGVGMSEAVLRAATGLSLPVEAADTVYCDINGERYRSEEWGFFAMRAHRTMRSLAYEAPSGSWGDVGAAFGALAGVLCVQSFARGYARGPRALVMAGSEGGLRGAMVLQAPEGWRGRRRDPSL